MDNGTVAIIAFSTTAAIVLAIVWLVGFIRRFNSDTEYYYWKMETADTKKEMRRWRREIRCHYLCLIPFVNNKNVVRVYNKIYRKKIAAEAAEDDENSAVNIKSILLPSVIGILICAACLCRVSWAWFTASTSTSTATVESASFKIDDINMAKDGHTVEPDTDGKYNLDAGNYTLTFKKSADSTSKKGFCIITVSKIGETAATPYYTDNIDGSFTLIIKTNTQIKVGIKSSWGAAPLSGQGAVTVASGGVIEVLLDITESNENITPTPSDGTPHESPDNEPENSDEKSTASDNVSEIITESEPQNTETPVSSDKESEFSISEDAPNPPESRSDTATEQTKMP